MNWTYEKIYRPIFEDENTQTKDVDSGNIRVKEPFNALNRILYGPPGTGKTFITRRKAVEIVGMIDKKINLIKSDLDENSKFVLIDNLDEIKANIRSFNSALDQKQKGIVEKLSQFGHWYYSKELNMFGPSKFIGYKNMSAERYVNVYYHLTGTDTEKALEKFHSNESDKDLQMKLRETLMKFGKEPKLGCFVHRLDE